MNDDLVTDLDSPILVVPFSLDPAQMDCAVGGREILERSICAWHKVPMSVAVSITTSRLRIDELLDGLAVGRQLRSNRPFERQGSLSGLLGIAKKLDLLDPYGL